MMPLRQDVRVRASLERRFRKIDPVARQAPEVERYRGGPREGDVRLFSFGGLDDEADTRPVVVQGEVLGLNRSVDLKLDRDRRVAARSEKPAEPDERGVRGRRERLFKDHLGNAINSAHTDTPSSCLVNGLVVPQ